MSFFIVRLDTVKPQKWRNGGGVTRELMAWPPSRDSKDWKWRMSVAEVSQSGPFSSFPGVQRWFAVLSGAGVRLTLDGRVKELTPSSEPFAFDGAAQPGCDLIGGVTEDFNLMLQGMQGAMERFTGRMEKQVAAGDTVAVYAYGTGAGIRCGDEALSVPPNSLAVQTFREAAMVEVSSPRALWMEIRP